MKFYVEANIGSGKTTILNIIKQYFNENINTIQEPVDEWIRHEDSNGQNILTKYYNDMQRWSFTFQINSLSTRLNRFLREYIPDKANIIERSIFSDGKCFSKLCLQDGNMDNLEYFHYQQILNLMINNFNVKPDGIIYLRTDPLICQKRINNRSRKGEEGIAIDYLNKLHEVHEEWINELKKEGQNVLELDGNLDFESDPKIKNRLMRQIHRFIYNYRSNILDKKYSSELQF